jgi:hypothetical protein
MSPAHMSDIVQFNRNEHPQTTRVLYYVLYCENHVAWKRVKNNEENVSMEKKLKNK